MPRTTRPPAEAGSSNRWPAPGRTTNSRRGRARRLRGDERSAIRRRRHRIGRADEDQGRNRQPLALTIGARGIVAGGGAQAHPTRRRRRKRKGDVGALREADDGHAPGVDKRLTRQIAERRRSVGGTDGEIDRTGFLEAARRELVDEQRDIAPTCQRRGESGAVLRQTETGVDERDGGERPRAGRRRQIASQRGGRRRAAERRRGIGDDDAPLGGWRCAGESQNGDRGDGEMAADDQAHGRAPCAWPTSPRRRTLVKRAQFQASQAVPKASVTRVSGRPTLK